MSHFFEYELSNEKISKSHVKDAVKKRINYKNNFNFWYLNLEEELETVKNKIHYTKKIEIFLKDLKANKSMKKPYPGYLFDFLEILYECFFFK